MKEHFVCKTLDDVMWDVVKEIRARGFRISPSKGDADEITGVLLEISNPRARLSRTETRGRIFSTLGELCWYLAGRNDLSFIEYYIRTYRESAEGDIIFGGYGPRLFHWRGINQVENVIGILSRKPHSRQAVMQLFEAADIVGEHKDVPCTCTLQFMNRGERLHMFVTMRSNDVHWGLPHDVFCFTMLQEIIARSLGIDVGTYKHWVGSLHLYKKHSAATDRFVKEGVQPTRAVMPPMPVGDPWPAIKVLLRAEETIRNQGAFDERTLGDIDVYWADLIRLLEVFGARKDLSRARQIGRKVFWPAYRPFIERVVSKIKVVSG